MNMLTCLRRQSLKAIRTWAAALYLTVVATFKAKAYCGAAASSLEVRMTVTTRSRCAQNLCRRVNPNSKCVWSQKLSLMLNVSKSLKVWQKCGSWDQNPNSDQSQTQSLSENGSEAHAVFQAILNYRSISFKPQPHRRGAQTMVIATVIDVYRSPIKDK